MIRLSISAGLLTADFTPGEPVPEDVTLFDSLPMRGEPGQIVRVILNGVEIGPGATPADTLPPEDTGSATLPLTRCSCELKAEPGHHPICDVFERSIIHADLCITCYHAEGCHS